MRYKPCKNHKKRDDAHFGRLHAYFRSPRKARERYEIKRRSRGKVIYDSGSEECGYRAAGHAWKI